MIDGSNSVVNYSRYHTYEIRATIKVLSPEQRQRLLDEIQLRKATYNLLGREYNYDDYKCVEKLLKKET